MTVSQVPEATRCARHPGVETYLRCSRCDTPICPNCLVQTPVGARCRNCAGLKRLPTFQASKMLLVRGFLAAVAVAMAGAFVIDLVRGFGFILTIVLGVLLAEAVSLAANRRRGPYFAWTAAIGAVIGMLLERGILVFIALDPRAPEIRLQGALAAMASINLIGWVMILAVAGIAFYRLRQ
jgi:B-box zinc finger